MGGDRLGRGLRAPRPRASGAGLGAGGGLGSCPRPREFQPLAWSPRLESARDLAAARGEREKWTRDGALERSCGELVRAWAGRGRTAAGVCAHRPDPEGAASPPRSSSLGGPGRVTPSQPGPGTDVWDRKGRVLTSSGETVDLLGDCGEGMIGRTAGNRRWTTSQPHAVFFFFFNRMTGVRRSFRNHELQNTNLFLT